LNSILRIGLALGLFLLPALPAEAAGVRKFCEAEVQGRLDLLKVDPSDIREITYDAQYSGRDNRRLVRLLAWVGLHSCKGYVIVDLTRQAPAGQPPHPMAAMSETGTISDVNPTWLVR
jgi:hypothetical protein